MKTLFCSLIISLGLVLCAGCGDSSSQSWENGKPQSSAGKSSAKSADVANNDATSDDSSGSGDTETAHGTTNPHAGMPMGDATASTSVENDGKLDVGTVHWTVPKSWLRKQPNMMLKAEYAIPHVEGDKQDGRVTVSQVGGSIEGNLARWRKQFQDKPNQEHQETIDVVGAKITLLDLAGTFDDPGNMTAAPVTRPDYRMFGAAIEIPGANAVLRQVLRPGKNHRRTRGRNQRLCSLDEGG